MRAIDGDALIDIFDDRLEKIRNRYGDYSGEAGVCAGALHLIRVQPTIEERKTGKWLKVGGYVTPGGDPVWCCSECGKGMHVYGIEHRSYGSDISDGQWVACPNCDAKMEETEC